MSPFRPVNLGSALSSFDRLQRHLDHHADRQQVIAANLANIDTPGYRAKDVGFSETLSEVAQKDGGTERTMEWSEEVVVADDEAPDQDGNTVSLEGQMAKMSANMVRYKTLSEMLNRRIGIMRYAANDGG
jgi:flagellar basal-body rod protein FlgB